MNNKEKYKEDPLREYIDPDRIEKAPEGFTDKMMARIQIGSDPLKVSAKLQPKSIVPVISAVITLILIITVFIIPSGSNDPLILPRLKLIQNIDPPVFNINFDSLFNFNLPVWLPYLFIGMLILTIFDKALYLLFHRGDNRKSESNEI